MDNQRKVVQYPLNTLTYTYLSLNIEVTQNTHFGISKGAFSHTIPIPLAHILHHPMVYVSNVESTEIIAWNQH